MLEDAQISVMKRKVQRFMYLCPHVAHVPIGYYLWMAMVVQPR